MIGWRAVLAGATQMPVLQTPAGHQPPQLGARLGQGAEGVVFESLNEPGWVVKVFHQGANPLSARNQLDNLAKARAIPGRADNVVNARPLVDPTNPRGQNWLAREEVVPSNVSEDLTERNAVLQDFQNIPDATGNLSWGTTKDNLTPRWILIE